MLPTWATEQQRWPTSAGKYGSFRLFTQSRKLRCSPAGQVKIWTSSGPILLSRIFWELDFNGWHQPPLPTQPSLPSNFKPVPPLSTCISTPLAYRHTKWYSW